MWRSCAALLLGAFAWGCNATIAVTVREAETGAPIPAKISVFDPATGDPVVLAGGSGGTLAILYQQMVFLGTGQGQIVLPPGEYDFWASRGIEYAVDHRRLDLTSATTAVFELAHAVDTTGHLAADFHIHARPSFESVFMPGGLPSLHDRVLHLITEGIEIVGSADHDCISDYQPVIASMGLASVITTVVGVEATPGTSAYPDGAGNCDQLGPTGPYGSEPGHWNGFPLLPTSVYDTMADSGADVSAATIYDMLVDLGDADTLVQLNHPYHSYPPLNTGWLDKREFDPSVPVPPTWTGTTEPVNSFLRRPSIVPGSPTQGIDFDLIEMWANGWVAQGRLTRAAWFSLLDQGFAKVATSNSDSHHPGTTAGFPRSLVDLGTDEPATATPQQIAAAVRAGKVIGTTGPFPTLRIDGAGMGELVTDGDGTLDVEIRVQAAPWVPVEEIRVVVNGEVVATIVPPLRDPEPSERFAGTIPVAIERDSWVLIEAGAALPADPEQEPPEPEVYSRVTTGFTPLSYTNPVFVDFDGNGQFDPPGL